MTILYYNILIILGIIKYFAILWDYEKVAENVQSMIIIISQPPLVYPVEQMHLIYIFSTVWLGLRISTYFYFVSTTTFWNIGGKSFSIFNFNVISDEKVNQ